MYSKAKHSNLTKTEKTNLIEPDITIEDSGRLSASVINTISKLHVKGIVIPKPKLKFEGLDNISIIGENDIPLSELFELHLKLENYLKSRPEAIINERGSIVGYKNYR